MLSADDAAADGVAAGGAAAVGVAAAGGNCWSLSQTPDKAHVLSAQTYTRTSWSADDDDDAAAAMVMAAATATMHHQRSYIARVRA